MMKHIKVQGQRVKVYSQDGGHTWSSNPQSIIAYGRRKKMLRLEIQKRFERIDERKELAGVLPTRGGLPRLLQLPRLIGTAHISEAVRL